MGPEPIIEEKGWEDIIPPTMVYGLHVLPLFDNPVEGILGNLENPPQYFVKQKRRGRLSHELLGYVPNPMMECAPFCQSAGSRPRANPWLAG